MAEQRNGYVCRRLDNGELVGHEGTFIQWHTLEQLSGYCRPENPSEQILGAVTYIGPDGPQWRERPTCPGVYIDSEHEYFVFNRLTIDEWEQSEVYNGESPWFGPLPAIPPAPR